MATPLCITCQLAADVQRPLFGCPSVGFSHILELLNNFKSPSSLKLGSLISGWFPVLDNFSAWVIASRASIGITAGAAGVVTAGFTGCPALETDAGPPSSWLSESDNCLSACPPSSIGGPSSSPSESDQGVALCWLILFAADRFLRAYLSLVVVDIRQYNDRAGWLLLALAAHERQVCSQITVQTVCHKRHRSLAVCRCLPEVSHRCHQCYRTARFSVI